MWTIYRTSIIHKRRFSATYTNIYWAIKPTQIREWTSFWKNKKYYNWWNELKERSNNAAKNIHTKWESGQNPWGFGEKDKIEDVNYCWGRNIRNGKGIQWKK